MFKLGGQADQGTGIMSTVEPKQTIRQNPYTGYAIGGRIGYANGPGPFGITSPIPPVAGQTGFTPSSRLQDRFQRFKEMPTYVPFKENIDLDKILIEEGIITEDTPITERLKARELYKTRGTQGTTEKDVGSTREDLAFATGLGESKITPPPPPPKKDPNFVETDTSKPFNLLDEVRKESGELRALLGQDDDISKAEAALVLSEALGTPGTIAQKIQRGLKAAVPLKKAKVEQDKAITLTAYKLAKEKEQQQIRAGTLPGSIRELEYQAKSLKDSGDPKYANMSVQQIINESIRAAKPMSPESKARTEILLADRQTIRDESQALIDKQRDLNKLDPTKDKVKYDKLKQLYDKDLEKFQTYLDYPEFKFYFPNQYDLLSSQRIMRAAGGPTEDETESDVVASNVNFGGTTTPIKPVQKLDYATLRDRLPKEINDQVVQLLASSEQALQDFAYITSQNDVNNFNVKYGVNLIIPPAQQTS
jgi:hypothetical protein